MSIQTQTSRIRTICQRLLSVKWLRFIITTLKILLQSGAELCTDVCIDLCFFQALGLLALGIGHWIYLHHWQLFSPKEKMILQLGYIDIMLTMIFYPLKHRAKNNKNHTSCIRVVDVGTPPSSLSKTNEWESIEVQYHDFENLTTTRGGAVLSPKFTCFGHQWCFNVCPGGCKKSADGMVSIFLHNLSDHSIKVQYGIAVKDRDRKVKEEFVSKDKDKGREFAARGGSWGRINFCKRRAIIDALVEGTMIIEIRMKNIGETTALPIIPE